MSVATLVRDALDRVYPDELDERRAAHRRAYEVIGTFHDDRHDVAERHDDYLGELDRW